MSNGVKIPTTRTALRSFNQLIRSAEKMFYTKGYFSTTINDIVNEAEVSTGTFYIYFDGKYSLYEYIVQKYERELKAFLSQRTASCHTRLEMEIEGIKAFIIHAYNNSACYNLIWESLYISKEMFYRYYQKFANSYIRGLTKFSDQLRSGLDLSSVVYILMGISNFLGLKAITDGELTEEKLEVMASTVHVMLQNGLFKQA